MHNAIELLNFILLMIFYEFSLSNNVLQDKGFDVAAIYRTV